MINYPPMPQAGELNQEDAEGSTPIQSAVRAGMRKRAVHLASLGANPYTKDRYGQSAIRMARTMGWTICADLMEDAYTAWTKSQETATLSATTGS